MLFVCNLCPFYYDKLVGNATKNFANLVILGEMIETAAKAGKIITSESFARKEARLGKKKDEINFINFARQPYHQGPHLYY